MWKLSYRSFFETLLHQELVIAKDTCEATITKRLAWLVEPLVVSSHQFSFFFTFFRYISKNPNIFFFIFLTSLFSLYPSLFILYFFSFDSLKHWRNFNTHVNIPVKLLSLSVPVDSTRLASCYNRSIEEAKALTFNSWFQNIHFSCTIFPRSRAEGKIQQRA